MMEQSNPIQSYKEIDVVIKATTGHAVQLHGLVKVIIRTLL